VVAVAAVFTLARFSEAFLVLRAQSIGLPLMLAPGALVIMNVAYLVSAYPVGALSDRMDRVTFLVLGLLLLLVADLVLAFVPGVMGLAVGALLWELHVGFTQGLFAALVASTAPEELRGRLLGCST
jgi:MFS family permease